MVQAHGGGDRTERLDLEAIRRANEYRRKYLSDTDGDFVLGLVRGDNVCDVVDALLARVDELEIEAVSLSASAMWTSNVHVDQIYEFIRSRGFEYDWEARVYSRLPPSPPSPSSAPERTDFPPPA